MPGAPACRSRALVRAICSIVLVGGLLALTAPVATAVDRSPGALPRAPQPANAIRLPAPVHDVDPLNNIDVGLRKDRLRKSTVPGTTTDREDVVVAIGPTGRPVAVTNTQRLVITGAGSYIVRELGPARAAVGLGDTVPPVLELGT